MSSLPSPRGIGSLGAQAYRFVDFLKAAGQHFWQILPIGPTGCGDSPYQSFSAFAGNPYFIDPDLLAARGLLLQEELSSVSFGDDPETVDYGALFRNRFSLLRRAAQRFCPGGAEYAAFETENADWLPDYALFMALKEENGMAALGEWPAPLRLREAGALKAARARLSDRVRFWKTVQYLFFSQWRALKDYARKNGVELIGDIPIYVSPDSADLWARPDLFQVDGELRPAEVAGCPPDAFTPGGQLWGNPLYDWDRLSQDGFSWWIRRVGFAARVCDVVRIDHFRGFESYYAVPAGDRDASRGRWRRGPGARFVGALREKLPGVRVIAEDLGFLTEDVRRLLKDSGFPGMKVLQFAFDPGGQSDYLPYRYERNCVVYTGTHDNTTTEDWRKSAPPESVAYARRYLGVRDGDDFTGAMIRAAFGSVADTCIVPMQDHLRLGAGARLNTPGSAAGNWRWRVREEALSPALARRLRGLAALYGRLVPDGAPFDGEPEKEFERN